MMPSWPPLRLLTVVCEVDIANDETLLLKFEFIVWLVGEDGRVGKDGEEGGEGGEGEEEAGVVTVEGGGGGGDPPPPILAFAAAAAANSLNVQV